MSSTPSARSPSGNLESDVVEWLAAPEVLQEVAEEDRTALHVAAAADRVDVMDHLHGHSDASTLAAALALKDDFGYTPLHGGSVNAR